MHFAKEPLKKNIPHKLSKHTEKSLCCKKFRFSYHCNIPQTNEIFLTEKTSKILYGLFKYAAKPVQEFMDQDYIDLLIELSKSDIPKKAAEALEALEFLDRFNREYYNSGVYKNDPNALHCTIELRRAAYNNNNRIRRDIMNVFKKVV